MHGALDPLPVLALERIESPAPNPHPSAAADAPSERHSAPSLLAPNLRKGGQLLLIVDPMGGGGIGNTSNDKAGLSQSTPAADVDPVAVLEKLGGAIERNEDREVYQVDLRGIKITDAGLVNLKTLDLHSNKIVDLSPIMNMGKLETLYLRNNKIQNVPDLSKLIYITSISFQNNDLQDISGLKAMDGLQTLNITNNPMLNDLAPLSGLKRLKSLTAASCKITSTTDLQLMKSLQSLNIQGNPVPKAELQTLKTALPGCKILHN